MLNKIKLYWTFYKSTVWSTYGVAFIVACTTLGNQPSISYFIKVFAPAKFILLDEPFVGLAPLVCEAVIEMIRQQTPKKGIVLTDHNHLSVRQVASQIYLLADGILRKESIITNVFT